MNLVLLLLLAFAIVFQTPVVMLLLARIGLISSGLLRRYRKYIGFGMLVAGARSRARRQPGHDVLHRGADVRAVRALDLDHRLHGEAVEARSGARS